MKLFVVGYPKSGNTWIASLLARALQVESLSIGRFQEFPEFPRFSEVGQSERGRDRNSHISHVCKIHGFRFLEHREIP